MPNIKIKRESNYFGMLVKFNIWVDGLVATKIANGQEIQLNLEPGEHAVAVSYFGASSRPYVVNLTGDDVNISIKITAGYYVLTAVYFSLLLLVVINPFNFGLLEVVLSYVLLCLMYIYLPIHGVVRMFRIQEN